MAKAEQICNQLIRDAVPMVPHWYTPGSPEMEQVGGVWGVVMGGATYLSHLVLLQARSRGLPDDFEGSSVRVVEIEGLDFNMCCGTHVASLSHLQVCVSNWGCGHTTSLPVCVYIVCEVAVFRIQKRVHLAVLPCW